MSRPIQYTSFLVRLWRMPDMEPSAQPGGWQVTIKHLQSGRCWRLHSVAELLSFFSQQTDHTNEYTCIDVEDEA